MLYYVTRAIMLWQGLRPHGCTGGQQSGFTPGVLGRAPFCFGLRIGPIRVIVIIPSPPSKY